MTKDTIAMLARLTATGITLDDAHALRRIAMTLHRWHELECGDSNDHGSWAIVRGRYETRSGQHANGHGLHRVFLHDDDGAPYLERHHYMHGAGKDSVSYTRIPDREAGAKRRLVALMQRYPSLGYYIQGDPRGASLYIIRPGDVPEGKPADQHYNHGIAVHQ